MLREDSVEEVPLLTATMQNVRFAAFLSTLHLDFVHDKNELVLRLDDLDVSISDLFVTERSNSDSDDHV